MQALRNILELVRTRMAGLPASAKLLAGSLVIIIALGLFLVAQWSSTSSNVRFPVKAVSYEEARQFLAGRGVTFEEKDGQLMVPVARLNELVSQFEEQSGGEGGGIDFEGMLAQDSPFDTGPQRDTKKLIALQNMLGTTISGFRNVKSARVFIAPKPSTPLGASRSVQTASVFVTMRAGALTQEQADSIAAMVAGTQSGLKPEAVSINDGSKLYRTSFGRAGATGENLEQSLAIAERVQASIATIVAIQGAMIAVNPQVVTTERTSTKTEFRDGISVPVSESTSTSEMKGAPRSGEPGSVPNTGLSIVSTSGGAAQTSTERAESRYNAVIPGTTIVEKDHTGYATKIDVGVSIPWSYFVRVWRQRNPTVEGEVAKNPDEAAIAVIRDEEFARIRKLVEPIVSTDAVEGGKKGVVEVSHYYDFEEAPQQVTMAAGLGEFVLGGGSGAGGSASGLIKPIGLGALAIVSLFFMFNIARKASAREELPSAEELAGVPPKLESDDAEIVGEADEATPALEGMELDDDSLRRGQMLDQLNEMASRDPSELSGILRRWMRNTA